MSNDKPLPVLLVVEDDEGLQRQLKWAYEGYRVVTAGDTTPAEDTPRDESDHSRRTSLLQANVDKNKKRRGVLILESQP